MSYRRINGLVPTDHRLLEHTCASQAEAEAAIKAAAAAGAAAQHEAEAKAKKEGARAVVWHRGFNADDKMLCLNAVVKSKDGCKPSNSAQLVWCWCVSHS